MNLPTRIAFGIIEAGTDSRSRDWTQTRLVGARNQSRERGGPALIARRVSPASDAPSAVSVVQVFVFSTLYYLVYATFFSPAGLYTPLWGHTNADLSPLHHAAASSWTETWLAAEEGRDWGSLSNAFDQNVRLLSSALVFLLASLTALPMTLLLWRLRLTLVEHLVFCLHLWAFLIIVVTSLGFAGEALSGRFQGMTSGH
jgi:hypothetical protein